MFCSPDSDSDDNGTHNTRSASITQNTAAHVLDSCEWSGWDHAIAKSNAEVYSVARKKV